MPDPEEPTGPFAPQTLLQVGLAQAGDRTAFGDLLDRYGCRVRAWLRQAAALSDHDLDELTQEVNLKILRHLQKASFDDAGSFRGWVKTICRNTAANFRRGRGRDPVRGHLESIGTDSQPFEPKARDRSPASQAHERQGKNARQQRIDKLPETDRWLIAAREQCGLQFGQIAAEWNARMAAAGSDKAVSEDAMRVRYRRLLKTIGEPPA